MMLCDKVAKWKSDDSQRLRLRRLQRAVECCYCETGAKVSETHSVRGDTGARGRVEEKRTRVMMNYLLW